MFSACVFAVSMISPACRSACCLSISACSSDCRFSSSRRCFRRSKSSELMSAKSGVDASHSADLNKTPSSKVVTNSVELCSPFFASFSEISSLILVITLRNACAFSISLSCDLCWLRSKREFPLGRMFLAIFPFSVLMTALLSLISASNVSS